MYDEVLRRFAWNGSWTWSNNCSKICKLKLNNHFWINTCCSVYIYIYLFFSSLAIPFELRKAARKCLICVNERKMCLPQNLSPHFRKSQSKFNFSILPFNTFLSLGGKAGGALRVPFKQHISLSIFLCNQQNIYN